MKRVVAVHLCSLMAATCGSIVNAQVTTLASVDSSEGQANHHSHPTAMTPDGRYVVFVTPASNLVPGDTNTFDDVFVRDRNAGTTERVSVDSSGGQGSNISYYGAISADGRYVSFLSYSTNLVPGDTNATVDVFVRDRQLGLTTRVSVASSGTQADGPSWSHSISADGRYVAFQSDATSLVAGTTVGSDIFLHDRLTGQTTLVSVDSSGVPGNNHSENPALSADGRFVAYGSFASNLVLGDTNGRDDVFVHDRQTGQTMRVSVDSSGGQGDQHSNYPRLSTDGRYVTFSSRASNLVPGDTNATFDVFAHDRQTGQTTRVSVDSSGAQGDDEAYHSSITGDGRYVAFPSRATNIVPGDTNGVYDAYLHDRQTGVTERVSVAASGAEGNDSSSWGLAPLVSSDGRCVAFNSAATNLVPTDVNSREDAFVRDRHSSGFTSLCEPGASGVIACPCSNPPSGPGRGCDNSAATGGASLSAAGVAYLSTDSLVFTTTGQLPTALSVLVQGTTSPGAGIVYGQGVRCVAGTLKRLFTKAATGGSITAPDFGAGDPTVSTRSAALGNPISAGQSRWYHVFYRDPSVIGGCPATSTFSGTQAGRVDWSL